MESTETEREKKVYTFGLLGERVDYSRSPEIFQSIFAADNVRGVFDIINCPVERLGQRLKELQQSGYDALSVTIPHKESIVPFLDNIDRIAKALRSVNSIKFAESGICGLNTDTYGFVQQLTPHVRELKGKTAIILGAGGAARSVAYSLALDCEIAEIQFFSKGQERMAKTSAMLKDIFPRLNITCNTWLPHQELPSSASVAIIVNATPLGGPNAPLTATKEMFANLNPSALFYDLNYNGDGAMTDEARKRCRLTFDGLPMLIHQALRSYYLWTGRSISYEAVRARIDDSVAQ